MIKLKCDNNKYYWNILKHFHILPHRSFTVVPSIVFDTYGRKKQTVGATCDRGNFSHPKYRERQYGRDGQTRGRACFHSRCYLVPSISNENPAVQDIANWAKNLPTAVGSIDIA